MIPPKSSASKNRVTLFGWIKIALLFFFVLGGGVHPYLANLASLESWAGAPLRGEQKPFVTLASSASRALAAEVSDAHAPYYGKTVKSIQVSGLKRLEKDAVIEKVGTKVGQPLTAEQVRADIQALYGMGYFDEISVEVQEVGDSGVNVVYVIKERPVIASIDFEGNEHLTATDLKDVTKTKQWSILDISKVKEDIVRIQKHYEEKGFYLAKVTYELTAVSENEVHLTFKINDYDKVQIKKITFLNNRHFTDEQLKSVFAETKEGNILSFVSSSGNFKETSFKQDLQRLTYWYLDHGYVKFKTESPVVTVSDDKKWLFISIYVEEGDSYQMGSINFGGDLLFPKEDLFKELSLKTGDTFKISQRNADIQKLTEKYQDLGYAFVNVIPKINIHDESKTLDVEYDFEKGHLVHFGEINVVGNSKTYDKVIRRELRIHEGELFNGTNLRLSKENVERLGYFSPGEVIFNTVSPKGQPDVLNVEISVKERSTGTVTLGAGYGSIQKFFFTTQISEINLFGKGQTLSLAGQYSANALSRSLNLGFTDPYAFDTRWSGGFDVYAVLFPIPNRWTTFRKGFDVRVGHPFGPPGQSYMQGFLTYKFEGNNDLNPVSQDPTIISAMQADTGLLSSVTASVIRDKRNNRFETTGGNYQMASFETAGLGGDMKFFKWILNNRFYSRIVGDLVFRTNAEVGQITGYDGRAIPPSQKFYLGGPNNMKGYQLYLLGPQIPASANASAQPLGGGFEAFTLFELEYPVIREAGIKFVVFFDAGNTWENLPANGEPFVIRTDVGFGFRWFSPIGPLRFEWGFPLAAKPGEQSPVFNFFIGPPF